MTTAVGSATETVVCEETTNGLYSEESSRITDEAKDRLRELRTHLENRPDAARNWNASGNHTPSRPKPLSNVEGRVDAGLRVEWGGSDGTRVSATASAEVRDNKGNYADATYSKDAEKNTFEVHAGRDSTISTDQKEKK